MNINNELLQKAKEYGLQMEVEFNDSQLLYELKERTNGAQKKLDAQVLKDSNKFCPKDTSVLEKTSILSTVLGSGILVWNTPYAKAQYYGINFDHSKSRNPNARAKWFEEAKALHLEEWRKLVENEYNGNS